MSEPSPGPYEPKDFGDRTVIVDADGRPVCWVEVREWVNPGITLANAKLLAASWKLLKAAEETLERFQAVSGHACDFAFEEDFRELHKAASEARGGVPWKPPSP